MTDQELRALVRDAVARHMGRGVAAGTTGARGTTGTTGTTGTVLAGTPSLEHDFLHSFLRDQKAIWTSPYHMKSSDLKWIVPLGVGTAAFIATDRRFGDEVAESEDLYRIGTAVSYAGTGWVVASASASLYLVGRATGNARARETGLLSFEAWLDAELLGAGIKAISQRSRPDSGESRGNFFAGGTAFPAGHGLGIWSMATVVAHEYHGHRWIQITSYAAASSVSLARIAAQRHYASDVLVGSALGYAVGRYVYRTHKRLDREDATGAAKPARMSFIVPEFDRKAKSYGLRFGWVY
jgi:membrane-associated phospholipid phosphatase